MQTLPAYFIAKLTCHNNDKKLGTWLHSRYLSTKNEIYVNSKPENRLQKNDNTWFVGRVAQSV